MVGFCFRIGIFDRSSKFLLKTRLKTLAQLGNNYESYFTKFYFHVLRVKTSFYMPFGKLNIPRKLCFCIWNFFNSRKNVLPCKGVVNNLCYFYFAIFLRFIVQPIKTTTSRQWWIVVVDRNLNNFLAFRRFQVGWPFQIPVAGPSCGLRPAVGGFRNRPLKNSHSSTTSFQVGTLFI